MSYQIGRDALNLRPTPRLAHTEYCSNAALKRAVTGLPDDDPAQTGEFYRLWDYDFIWSTTHDPLPWEERGRMTDMGHSEFLEGGVDKRQPAECPFKTVEEVLSFDAASEYGLSDLDFLVNDYRSRYERARREYPEQVWTGGYYRTLFSGAIAIFGWDMLLRGAAYPSRFARVLDSIYQQTMHHVQAWARTPIEFFMCHDDMVWAQGPFMRPDFYRAEIFPRYKALWDVLKKAGKKIIFTSDGDWSMFVDDIVEAGADALCFEPLVPLAPVAEKYGRTHCLLASDVDARTLTFGDRQQIRAEIDSTLELTEHCAGLIVAVGNHIPSNVPVGNALYYFDYLRSRWWRS